jgi:endonuclease YncB( thermonuclease family)
VVLFLLLALDVSAHPGGLNKQDCHNNTSTGDYHCHSYTEDGSRSDPEPLADLSGRVIAVSDGDTIKVLDGANKTHKIRLAGIDAPERDQSIGNASRKGLTAMVAGKQVHVEAIKHDRYGRVLGKVWVRPEDCPSCG